MSGSTKREELDSVYDMPVNPRLSDLFRIFERNLRLRLRTAAPAKVVSYDSTTQKVDVELQTLPVIRDPNVPTGERVSSPIIIKSVPVAWKRTSTARQTMPIAPGDTGQIIACDRSIEAWLQNGVAGDPYSFATHSFADSVFYPGFHDDTNPITPAPSATAHVIEGTEVHLGALAVLKAVLGDTLVSVIDGAIAAALAGAVIEDGGTAAFTAFQTYWNLNKNTTLSNKVKVE